MEQPKIELTVEKIVKELAADDPARVARMIAYVLINGGQEQLAAVATELAKLAHPEITRPRLVPYHQG